jgi:hypothetical protein
MNTHSHSQDGPQPMPARHLNEGRPSYSSTNPEVGSGSAGSAVRRLEESPKPEPGQVPSSPVPGAIAKNEALYVILGLLIPGLPALLIKEDKVTGGIQLGLWVLSWILAFFVIGFFIWIGVAIWSAIDGYQAAKLWNRRHGFIT